MLSRCLSRPKLKPLAGSGCLVRSLAGQEPTIAVL